MCRLPFALALAGIPPCRGSGCPGSAAPATASHARRAAASRFPPPGGPRLVLSLLSPPYSGFFLDFLKFGACFEIAVIRRRLGKLGSCVPELAAGTQKGVKIETGFLSRCPRDRSWPSRLWQMACEILPSPPSQKRTRCRPCE